MSVRVCVSFLCPHVKSSVFILYFFFFLLHFFFYNFKDKTKEEEEKKLSGGGDTRKIKCFTNCAIRCRKRKTREGKRAWRVL